MFTAALHAGLFIALTMLIYIPYIQSVHQSYINEYVWWAPLIAVYLLFTLAEVVIWVVYWLYCLVFSAGECGVDA